MANTIISLFDDVEQAQRAVEDLTLAGFTHDDIRIMDREKVQAAPGAMDSLRSGGSLDEEFGLYAEGVRRGGVLIAVDAPDERADEVRGVIGQHNPANIAERADYYRSTGYSGHDQSQPPYSDDEIAADREGYNQFAATGASHISEGARADSGVSGLSSPAPAFHQSYVPAAPGGIGEANTPSYTQNYPGGDNITGMTSRTSLTGASDTIGTTGGAMAGGMNHQDASPGSRYPVPSNQADAEVRAVADSSPGDSQDTRPNAAMSESAAGGRPVVDPMTSALETAQDRINREGEEAHNARVGGPVNSGENAWANSDPHHARVSNTRQD